MLSRELPQESRGEQARVRVMNVIVKFHVRGGL